MINRFQQFSVSIASIYRYIQKIERDEMVKLGLKGSYAQYLTVLNLHEEGLTATQLCDICDKDKAAISRVMAEMEEKGLVERAGNGARIYRAPLTLTPLGKQTATHVLQRAKVAVEHAGQGLSDENRKTFYAALDLIACHLQAISKQGIPDA